MRISYDLTSEGCSDYQGFIQRFISPNGGFRVADLGGGANPVLELEDIKTHRLTYTVYDAEVSELEKCAPEYEKQVLDLTVPNSLPSEAFDLVFTKWVIEHLPDARVFHQNCLQSLVPGGTAVHFFPTLWALPYLVNYLVPESISQKLLRLMQSGREESGNHSKFPAKYDWCRGPLHSQIKRFEKIGFEVIEYHGFYGHDPYYRKFPPLLHLHQKISRILVEHPIPLLTSFAYVVLRKPLTESAENSTIT